MARSISLQAQVLQRRQTAGARSGPAAQQATRTAQLRVLEQRLAAAGVLSSAKSGALAAGVRSASAALEVCMTAADLKPKLTP